jgi:hypothetical protein
VKFIQKTLVSILVLSLIAGCQSPKTGTPQAASPSGPTPAPGVTQAPAQTGPSASLADPIQALDQLGVYQASLQLSFSGTQAGKPSQWSQSYRLGAARDANLRLLTYAETGLEPGAALYPAFSGTAYGVDYYRGADGDVCVGNFARETPDPSGLPEPASLLPKINVLIQSGPPETVNGISATPYTVDSASFNHIATAQARGQVWLAARGTVVKYTLTIAGGNDFFDRDTAGTITWDYEIRQPAADAALLPADCPLPLPDVPLLEDARSTIKFPGYTSFESGMDLRAAADFYMNTLPASGFTPVGEAQIGETTASLAYTKDSQTIDILIETQSVTRVVISRKAVEPVMEAGGQPLPKPSPTPNLVATEVAGSPQTRVIKALTALLGEDDRPSVYPSYHLDYAAKLPSWDNAQGVVVQKESRMAADVQGKNVHFISTALKGSGSVTSDVYVIDDQEYEVINGTPTPGLGMKALAWAMWPLDVIMVLSISSLKTAPAGTETIDGRATEVYQISGKASDDPTGMIAAFGQSISQSAGKVWVDQATGGLTKLQIDYEMDVKDSAGTVKGHAPASLEITVTQIGAVRVELK